MKGYCGTDQQWWMVLLEACSQGIQKFGRLDSSLLALSTALIRTITVMFPMSYLSDALMKVKTGIALVFLTSGTCETFYTIHYYLIGIEREGRTKKSCWIISGPAFYNFLFINLEGYLILMVAILYFLVTFALLIALALAKKRRKNLNAEKSSNTSLLVTSNSWICPYTFREPF
ncbi:unnamed protein product [Caenorhabditis brenneri]